MNQQDQEYTDELLSAYLDGELTADECARVEQLLATSDTCRRTFDAMRYVASEMKSLPAFQLDEHFPQRILSAARQAESSLREVDAGLRSAGHVGHPARSSSRWGWRTAALAFVATAAAALIAVFSGVFETRPSGSDVRGARPLAKLEPKASVPLQQDKSVDRSGTGLVDDRNAKEAADDRSDGDSKPARQVAQDALAAKAASDDVPAGQTIKIPSVVAGPGSENTLKRTVPRDPPSADAIRDSAQPAASSSPRPADSVKSSLAAEPANLKTRENARPSGTQKMLFVIDAQLTRAGWENGGFEQVLAAHGVTFDANIQAQPDLENALLKSRFFEPMEDRQKPPNAKPDDEDPPRREFALVYVTTRGGAIDSLWRDMQRNEEYFARVSLDVSLNLAAKPEDLNVFRQLQQLAGIAAPIGLGDAENRLLGAGAMAHRLVLSPAWRGAPATTFPGIGGFPGVGGQTPRVPGLQGDQMPRGGALGGELFGGNIYTEVLFVLRAAP